MKCEPIDGQKLTSWGVLSDGTHISLDFAASDGETHCIIFPVDALSGLMMTLPRMLQSALDRRFPNRSLRVAHRLGEWRLEQQEIDDSLILKLATKDGFEVAFVLSGQHAGSLGAALVETESTLARRPN
jgi:hypothetical protein